MIPLTLSGSVGLDEDNDPDDVTQAGTALATLGHLDALRSVQSGEFDTGLDNAIRTYQSDNELEPDGVLLPNGPTQSSLNNALRVQRPRPSLLPAEDDSSSVGGWPQDVPRRGASETSLRENPRAQDRDSSQTSVAFAENDLPRGPLTIPNRAARNLSKAQENSASLSDVLGTAIEESGGRGPEQIMKARGYRYVPDPMGRIDEGDWVNERGDRVASEEVRAISRQPEIRPRPRVQFTPDVGGGADGAHGVIVVAARASAPARRIESNFDHLADDLDTATAYVKRGEGNVRVSLPARISASTVRPAEEVSRINAGMREAVVANALLNRPTGPEEIASVAKDIAENPAHGPKTGRSRIKDMLTEAALNGATPEQRLHARGLLAVYEMEEREAEAARRPDARAGADAALAAFAAGMSGDVSWSVYDAELRQDDNDYEEDDEGAEPAADDPDHPRRPRGSQNDNTRGAARDGRRLHRELDERVQKKKDLGWRSEVEFFDEKTGKRYRFDVTTPSRRGKYYILEYKPDTPTGRAAGQRQCAEYTRVTGMRCRVIYYQPPSNISSRGSGGVPKLTRPWGIGSNRLGNPKLPRSLSPWELLE